MIVDEGKKMFEGCYVEGLTIRNGNGGKSDYWTQFVKLMVLMLLMTFSLPCITYQWLGYFAK
jgi:hypothetical protein